MVSEPRTDCKTALRQVCTGRDGGARYSAGVCWYSVRPPAVRREAKQGGNTVRFASSLMVDSLSRRKRNHSSRTAFYLPQKVPFSFRVVSLKRWQFHEPQLEAKN